MPIQLHLRFVLVLISLCPLAVARAEEPSQSDRETSRESAAGTENAAENQGTTVKVAAISFNPVRFDVAANAESLERWFRKAAAGGAQLAVAPEGAIEGYVIKPIVAGEVEAEKMADVAQPIDSPVIQKFQKLAAELQMNLVFGFAEKIDQDVFNCAVFIDDRGEIRGKYHKMQLAEGYQEDWWWNRLGRHSRAFDTPLGRCGVLICNDRWNPMLARIPALDGAQFLVIPSFGSTSTSQDETVLARSVETDLPIVEANVGVTLVVDDGQIAAVDRHAEGITFAEITIPPPRTPDVAARDQAEAEFLQWRQTEMPVRWRAWMDKVKREQRAQSDANDATATTAATPSDDGALQFHLMHPGGASLPGDPNAAFYLDGVYHLHYILRHPWQDRTSFSFVHVTSPDMLHWSWQPTKLQPSFTGHGMFSGTGFITKDQQPAVIYHGESSGRNQIAIATDNQLSAWEKPYPVDVRDVAGNEVEMNHWDPDCFLIGDTYYAISGGQNPPLLKSKDLKTWTHVGDFLQHDLPDVAKGEDISCPNFFPIGDKWMLLCISHDLGCRYYLGDWDAKAEQFVPQSHGRMNWRREDQSLFSRQSWRADFFAPESVQTPDGRRVMWAWCATVDRNDGRMSELSIQSLPRELSVGGDGRLRIKPLRELESLRYAPTARGNVEINQVAHTLLADCVPEGQKIADFDSEAMELRITVPRQEAERKLFGFTLFADREGNGLPIVFRPETASLRVGTAEAPFAISDLATDEDLSVRVFVDRQLVEVFVNDRQAMIAYYDGDRAETDVVAFSVGAPTRLKKVETWQLKPTNQGFREAQQHRRWEPNTR
jgi:predicted amidohydrolase/sucrose-6-phosphate hydrolase SacC (GH32 family)